MAKYVDEGDKFVTSPSGISLVNGRTINLVQTRLDSTHHMHHPIYKISSRLITDMAWM